MTATALIGGSIVGGLIQGNMAQSAGQAQAGAANNATQAQMNMFNVAQGNLKPYMNFGNNALTGYNALLGLGGGGGPGSPGGVPNMTVLNNALMQTPGFQFENYFGSQAVQNSFAARGLGSSGAALQGAAKFSTGLASQTYQNMLGDYASAAGLGANAAAGVGGMATTTGQGIASSMQNYGAGIAAGYNGMGAGINNALTGGVNAYMGYQGLMQNKALINALSGG